MFKRIGLVLLIGVVLLAACGGGGGAPAATPVGNADNGKAVFNGVGGCSACHSVEPGKTGTGPSLAGISEDGPSEIRDSIVNPNEEVLEGFKPGVMPTDFGQKLSEQQINDLVAYLMTLK